MNRQTRPPVDAELDESVAPLLPGMDIEAGAELLQPVEVQRSAHSGKIVEANQARVQAILAARAMGLSIRQVCSAYQVGTHTLVELERRHGAKLATLKERVARRLGAFVELGLDRMLESVGSMDPDKLPLAVAIAIDKMQVLTGEPSIIVGDTGPRRLSVDTLRDRLEGAIDVTPATGLSREDKSQKATGLGGGAGGWIGPAAFGQEGADGGKSDCGSDNKR
jgi:hypothetical protein